MKKVIWYFTLWISFIGDSQSTQKPLDKNEWHRLYYGKEIQLAQAFTPRITQEEYNHAQETTPLIVMAEKGMVNKKEVLETYQFIGVNFKKANMPRAKMNAQAFNLMNASNTNFRGSSGQFVRMIGANLQQANFQECQFEGGDFFGVLASKTKFDQASLLYCRFEKADLTSASFKGANLEGCTFINCLLDQADFSEVKGKYSILPKK